LFVIDKNIPFKSLSIVFNFV